MTATEADILLVEDDEADILHFQRLCKKSGIKATISISTTGDEALERLRAKAKLEGRRQLIVTDLNMPGLSGHELIKEIRDDRQLASSVIFVVSSSDMQDDIEKAYDQHIAGYIIKDQSGERLEAGVAMLHNFIEAVTLHC